MWEFVEGDFKSVPSQAQVAKYLLDTGIHLDGDKLYVDKIAISHSQLAAALGKDKRTVTATVRTIIGSPRLYSIFSKIRPTCNLTGVASEMGWGVIEITLSDPAMPGVLGRIALAIGETGISIRQAIGEDPTFSTGLLYIVTETRLPGHALDNLRAIKGIKKITLL